MGARGRFSGCSFFFLRPGLFPFLRGGWPVYSPQHALWYCWPVGELKLVESARWSVRGLALFGKTVILVRYFRRSQAPPRGLHEAVSRMVGRFERTVIATRHR